MKANGLVFTADVNTTFKESSLSTPWRSRFTARIISWVACFQPFSAG